MTWAIGWNGAGTRPVFYLNTIKIKPIRLSMCNKSCVEHIKPRFNWWSLLIFSLSGWHDRQSTELYFVESHVQYNFTAWQWTFYVPKMSISLPRSDVKSLWSIYTAFYEDSHISKSSETPSTAQHTCSVCNSEMFYIWCTFTQSDIELNSNNMCLV